MPCWLLLSLALALALALHLAPGAAAQDLVYPPSPSRALTRLDLAPGGLLRGTHTRQSLPTATLAALASSLPAAPPGITQPVIAATSANLHPADMPGAATPPAFRAVTAPGRSPAAAATNASILFSVRGINAVEQRLASGGNQLDREPPDQALCVGGGFLIEAVNSVLRVRNTSTGAALAPPLAINALFGYPPQYDYATRLYGPRISDLGCIYEGGGGGRRGK